MSVKRKSTHQNQDIILPEDKHYLGLKIFKTNGFHLKRCDCLQNL